MHELSIVMSIIDIAEKEAKNNSVSEFHEIELQIGTLSGIELSALEFSWGPATKNTVLEKAVLTIDMLKAIGKCTDCNEKFDIDNFFSHCPKCKSYLVEVIQGKELKIMKLVARKEQ